MKLKAVPSLNPIPQTLACSGLVGIFLMATAWAEDSVFISEPEMLQQRGAGEGPVWHPELGLLSSGDGNINRRDLSGETSVFRSGAGPTVCYSIDKVD